MKKKKNFVIGIGEVLWDMLPEGKRCGGAPANVVYHLNKLGINSAIVSAVGNDLDGEELLAFLNSHGVCTKYITKNNLRTGIVDVTITDGFPQYNICQPVAWDNIVCLGELLDISSEITAVVFGSLAQRSSISKKSIQDFILALPTSCLRIFDINLRQNFYSADLIRCSLDLCNILKINEEELNIVAKIFNISGSHQDIIQTLAKEYSLQAVIFTLGANGSMLFDNKNFKEYPILPCKVVDTIGCGDAFLAAWIASILNGESMDSAMIAGTKLSSKVASQAGAIEI